MKKILYFKLFLFSVLAALALSLISLYCLIRISDMVVEEYRYGYLMNIGRAIERTNETRPVTKINVRKYISTEEVPLERDSRPLSLLDFSRFTPPNADPVQHKRQSRPSLWLVSEEGEIISSNAGKELPKKWEKLYRPQKVHGIVSNESYLFSPKTFVVKLDTTPISYLVSYNERSLFHGPFLWVQGLHTFTTVALAVFLALSLIFYYLRKKSREARSVLQQLEAGDLKARFEIQRFDEFGSLLLDFNRMAEQIERLVKRLSETERSRSNLLQELGHDLRTPLTSLTTSFEGLKSHWEEIDQEDRNELFEMISADIRYFQDLLDKLTIVATIEAPHYKAATAVIDLAQILEGEIKNRQTASSGNLTWNILKDEKSSNLILGDYHLVTRLFKNAFDNSARYAKGRINVKVSSVRDKIEILVMDDGPGLSHEALNSFGKRRERRHVKERDAHDFSLGLGSVIMKTIAEAHDGTIAMFNLFSSSEITGACLKVTFKRP